MTDQTESASEHAELLVQLDEEARYSVLSRYAAAAIRELEAKVRELQQVAFSLGNTGVGQEHHAGLRADRDRLAGEVERLEMKLREKQREMDMREEDNREDILSLREFGERMSNEVARLTSELAAAREALADIGDCPSGFPHYCANCDRSFSGDAARRAGEGEAK